jgi:hypothetical protein
VQKFVAATIAAIVAAVSIVVYISRQSETTRSLVREPEQPQVPASDRGTPAMTAADTSRASRDDETSRSVPTPTADEAKQAAECQALSKRGRDREQAARDSELKDPAWAYEMEQKLREYASRRFRTTTIEVIAIDCRTSFCEITAQGFVPESKEFYDGLQGAGKESWNDFTGTSTSHTEEAGKIRYHGEVSRRQSYRQQNYYSEREQEQVAACIQLGNQQDQRKRATRDAEPRDAGWADPTEQLLRQYLVAQVAKHPVEQLDITCRTTFCQIKASGRGTESYLAFQKAAQEAASEPWSDLRNGGGGGSGYGEGWQQDYMLHRRDASN